MITKTKLYNIFKKCWSIESSTRWEETSPSKGQCSVTALVIHDCFGGTILKTRVDGAWHFYNKINDQILDLTSDQFKSAIDYQDIESSVDEAFTDCSKEQYEYLKKQFALRYYT